MATVNCLVCGRINLTDSLAERGHRCERCRHIIPLPVVEVEPAGSRPERDAVHGGGDPVPPRNAAPSSAAKEDNSPLLLKSQPGQGYELLLPGGGLVLIGLAMVLVKDLREAGLYCVAAGVVVVAGLALLGRRQGLNAPAPPLAGPTALPHTSPSRDRCPMCGGTDLLVMNPRESVAFYGYDRFVLYMPRRCANCGHGFEIHPGVLGCYLLAGFSLLGVLFGLTLTLLGPFTGYMILFNRGEKGVDWRVLAGVVVCPGFGLIVMWRFIKETVRYWRLSKGPGRGELPAPSGDPD